jgi:PAS domain-containing protein
MARISQIAHMRPGDIQTLPLRVKTLEGRYVSWNTVATPYSYNDDGSVREFLCACFDIAPYHDELAQLQEENRNLLERSERLSQSFRSAPVGLMTVDTDGRVLSANPEGLRIFHADRDGWQDAYGDEGAASNGEMNRLQLGNDWLKAVAHTHRSTMFQIADLQDYVGNRRKFVLSVRAIRSAQGDISSYSIAFYDHAEIAMMAGRAIEGIGSEVPNGPEL